MIRQIHTLSLFVAALIAGTFRSGYLPNGWDALRREERAAAVHNLVAEVGIFHQHVAEMRGSTVTRRPAGVNSETGRLISAFEADLHQKLRDWASSGDERWVPAMRARLQGLVRRVELDGVPGSND